mmetsp:Transcript_29903/g.75306  ORF Transcript_29903/g.75306 Transcript_29903/m.75306 type:complete len:329 (+) Transcript_29903:53-1039(+)
MLKALSECTGCCSGSRCSLTEVVPDQTEISAKTELPPKIAAVIDEATDLLPGHRMSHFQRSWCTPSTVQVYLTGRAGDTQAAAKILAEALQWREKYKDILMGSRMPQWQSDFRVLTRARSGHPILYTCFRHILPANLQHVPEHYAAVFEAGVRSMRNGAQQFDIVVDCHGFSSHHLDPRPLFPFMATVRQPYRDRARSAIFVGAPQAFHLVFNLASKLVSEKTARKGMFKSPEDAVAHVLETAGSEAALALKEAMHINRQGCDCQPGEALGRKLPSEIDDVATLFKDPIGSFPRVSASAQQAVMKSTESETIATSRWGCCRRHRVKVT